LSGPVETTSAPYAIAKIAGIYLAQALARQKKLSVVIGIPATVYGPGDHAHEQKSHVLSGMMLRFHRAMLHHEKILTVWGSGRPRREFIHVDDAVRACRILMDYGKAGEIYNFGSGEEVRISALARRIASAVGFKGRLRFDRSRPDGAIRKLLDSSKMRALGWAPRVRLDEGIPTTYEQFKENCG
jgi:GDP-L-fucose synthase